MPIIQYQEESQFIVGALSGKQITIPHINILPCQLWQGACGLDGVDLHTSGVSTPSPKLASAADLLGYGG